MGKTLFVTIIAIFSVMLCWHAQSARAQSEMADFDETLALRLLRFAAIVNCDWDQLSTWTCAGCKNVPGVTFLGSIYDQVQHNFAYVALDEQNPNGPAIVLAIRGTIDWKNWVTDAQAWHRKVNFNNLTTVRVHAGWMKAFELLQTPIYSFIAKGLSIAPNARLIATGHSLGGAVAELFAVALATTQHIRADVLDEISTAPLTVYRNITVYNFGTPRVGDAAWAKLAQQCIHTYYRLTHAQDIVPRMPPTVWPLSYMHPPAEIWLPDATGKQIKHCSLTNGEDPTCINGSGPYSFKDHVQYLGHDVGHCTLPPLNDSTSA